MATILHIDTSSTVCSVGLSINGQLIDIIEENEGYSHAEKLHIFIQSILSNQKINTVDLTAVAVNKGPGSYTGLRIGVSAAKGMAFALNIPLISVNSLHAMCYNLNNENAAFFLPMIDARRMEVYTCLLDHNFCEIIHSHAKIIDTESYLDFLNYQPIICLGDGAVKCQPYLSSLPNIQFLDKINASVRNFYLMAFNKLKNREFEDIDYFEPAYLKPYYFKS
ncbi:MAG: tRNA (adenosine(37)-N6)-threonylcarbamoyltransferase complex dimerization subunit type 1 TsaB [Bacteroidota bacterium]|jgi:tRNA threonylcarbamoyladenosine biosynthesis protein TsaB